MIGSVISTWIAEPVSSFVQLGLGLGARSTSSPGTTASVAAVVVLPAASEARAPHAAPIAPAPQTHAAILSGSTRHSSVSSCRSPGNVNTASSTADPARHLSQRGRPLAPIEATCSRAADTGTPPPAGDCPSGSSAQPMMNRSRPSSRRQSNVANSGKTPPRPTPTNLRHADRLD
jgi:hypothetical protein